MVGSRMKAAAITHEGRRLRPPPTGAFIIFVGGVCLALAVSGVYTVRMLARLESAYLENRARETALVLDQQARGPGRRNNPDVWQQLLSESAASSRGSVVFLALLDSGGTTLAEAGESALRAQDVTPGIVMTQGARIFVYDFPLVGGRQGTSGGQAQVAGWRIRIGMSTSETKFIRRQAWIHVAVTGLAIATLLLLSAYLLRALRHYLEFKNRESSERHLRALGTMAATLAHEIRNPLGAMKGLTQLAQEELPADHKAQGMMATVVGEAQRLEHLVTDLLTFARLPKPRAEVFEIAGLLSTVKMLVEARLAAAQVTMEASRGAGLEEVRSDPELLRQLLINVMLNAIDASPAGGTVTLHASWEERKGDLRFDVCDSGPGVPPGDTEELFIPFHTSKTHGTGLGLAVSRQIAESLGGDIHLVNRPEGGACCTIRVPAGRS